MNIPYEDKMTNQMKEVYTSFMAQMEQEYLYCDEQLNKAKEARVKLPYVNEQGISVVHGCNMVVDRIGRYWTVRRDATKDFLSQEFIEQGGVGDIECSF